MGRRARLFRGGKGKKKKQPERVVSEAQTADGRRQTAGGQGGEVEKKDHKTHRRAYEGGLRRGGLAKKELQLVSSLRFAVETGRVEGRGKQDPLGSRNQRGIGTWTSLCTLYCPMVLLGVRPRAWNECTFRGPGPRGPLPLARRRITHKRCGVSCHRGLHSPHTRTANRNNRIPCPCRGCINMQVQAYCRTDQVLLCTYVPTYCGGQRVPGDSRNATAATTCLPLGALSLCVLPYRLPEDMPSQHMPLQDMPLGPPALTPRPSVSLAATGWRSALSRPRRRFRGGCMTSALHF